MIGGGEIYSAAIGLADRLYITHVHATPEGDTHFPRIDPRHLAASFDPGVPGGRTRQRSDHFCDLRARIGSRFRLTAAVHTPIEAGGLVFRTFAAVSSWLVERAKRVAYNARQPESGGVMRFFRIPRRTKREQGCPGIINPAAVAAGKAGMAARGASRPRNTGGGPTPPDLEELLRRSQDRLKKRAPGRRGPDQSRSPHRHSVRCGGVRRL